MVFACQKSFAQGRINWTPDQLIEPSELSATLKSNDKHIFVKRMMDSIKIGGYFLLVDYGTNKANHWVPYPLSIAVAGELFLKCGAASFEVLNRRKSIFGERWMYAALVKR